jgi:hypothetical protein
MLKDIDDILLLELSFLWTFPIVLKQFKKIKITKQNLKHKITTFRKLALPSSSFKNWGAGGGGVKG